MWPKSEPATPRTASVLGAGIGKCFEIAAVRPAFPLGLRAATATIVPLVIGDALDQPLFGWMSLGGWLCAIADPGGSYSLRARAMVTFAAAAALATGLGTVVSTSAALSIGLLFAGAVAASLAGTGGKAGPSVGTLALVLLCVALGWPARPELAGPRLAMVLGGCAISIGLALPSWPVHAIHRKRRPRASGSRELSERPHLTAPGALAADPTVLRHAVRMAVTVSVAAAIAAWIGVAPAFWVTAAVVIVLQPDSAATLHRAFHYVVGTVLGAGVAALLMPVLRNPALIGIVLFPLSALALALRPLNYGLFILLVTPVYLLMAEVLSGNSHLATARILSVFIGGGLAFAAQLVWPGRKPLTRSSPP